MLDLHLKQLLAQAAGAPDLCDLPPEPCRGLYRQICTAATVPPADVDVTPHESHFGGQAVNVRIYKPRAEVYQMVVDTMRVAPADVMFVSSNRWDVMGATQFGFRTAWINRARAPDEYPEQAPVAVLASLSELETLAA